MSCCEGGTRWRGLTLALIPLVALAAAGLSAHASPSEWRREGWVRTNFERHLIDWSDILSGGLAKDGIPAIDNPSFAAANEEEALSPNEAVIAIAVAGEARAYPLRIMMWHEIVNDEIAGIPIVVTYCPLCNASIVFDRRAGGMTLDFGTTGKLRNSDLVMYDRQTESWWQQFTGDAIVGELAGGKLALLPSRLESFASFRQRHANGKVLVVPASSRRDYGRNPYEGYDTSKVPFLFRGEQPEDINPMARVVSVRNSDQPFAIALELLRVHKAINVGPYSISWQAGQASALDHSTVAGGRDVGNVVVQKHEGSSLADVPYEVTFAFAFHAFQPKAPIIQVCELGSETSMSNSIRTQCRSSNRNGDAID